MNKGTIMNRKNGFNLWVYIIILSFLFGGAVSSCTVYSKAIGFGGNPEPNLKGVHMGLSHAGYTKEDWDAHPDEECNGKYVLIKDRVKKPKYEVDAELEKYLVEFVEVAKANGVDLSYIYKSNITIKYTDKVDGKVASAPSWQNRDGLFIVVRRANFKNRTEQGRKYVMFHEFGHDILNLEHSNEGMMRASSYSGFFKEGVDETRQNNYLYKSLKQLFDGMDRSNNN